MLPYMQIKGQVLSRTVPAHRMCQTRLIFFTFWDAALHQDTGTSALEYRACAQNVSSVTTVFAFWDAGPQHDEGSSILKHRAPKIHEEIRACCLADRQKVRQKVRRRSWMPNLAKEGFGTNRTKIPWGCFTRFERISGQQS
jgi:hypothetical protein